jgi:glycine betaine/proline transport system permease protein
VGDGVDWLTETKIPIGNWASDIVDWLTDNGAVFFDGLSVALEAIIDALLWILQTPPPLALVGFLVILSWFLRKSAAFTGFVLGGLLLIINQGYWEETTETLALVLAASTVCMAVGVPIGIAAAHRPRLYAFLRPILDLMQTLPSFVYLIPAIVFFGIGMVPGLIATAIFVVPAPIRLTHLGVSSTPKPLIEAGEAFGATGSQLLWKVELPYAMPQIMAGLTQTIMLSLSMVVIAALVGADGLGVPVVRALNTVNIAQGFEAGFVIVLVAIILDRFLRQSEPKGR